MNNRLLLTRTSGFAGQNLVPYLTEHNLRKLFLRYIAHQEIYLNDTEAIIHLAAKAYDLKNV
ncbi:hypothetical protein [Pedobacter glucosidilyticus]|uniref:hypothetical protein n=1 Tax=Pedobacter glucosidilyticus TaxID=1122941 RepID=UPI00047C7C04|nr:hypothetical protein [Pedobacter glucosidilyticus]